MGFTLINTPFPDKKEQGTLRRVALFDEDRKILEEINEILEDVKPQNGVGGDDA